MSLSVLLLRGINVGGANKLPMAELRAAIQAAWGVSPETYIQSGNAVFSGTVTQTVLTDEIEVRAGIRPDLLVLTAGTFLASLDANPFPTDDHKALHLFFLPVSPDVDPSTLEAAKSSEERFCLVDRVLYLHTPKYLTGSRIAPAIDRIFGVRATGRNWRTCEALRDMLKRRL